MIKEVLRQRSAERNYALNEENKRNWKYLIFFMNYCASLEKMLLEMRNSDMPPQKKILAYERFFSEAYERPSQPVLDSGLTYGELLTKYEERKKRAGNYLWVTDESERRILVNDRLLDQMVVPENFNCILISYHAFMLEITGTLIKL